MYIGKILYNFCINIVFTARSLNYYLAPLINNVELKENYVQELVNIAVPQTVEVTAPYSIKPPSLVDTSGATFFTKADPVWILFTNNAFGYLTLPLQLGPKCRSGPLLNYFDEKTFNCYATLNQIKNECNAATAQTPLSLAFFLSNFKIVKVFNMELNFFN
jgi:hypothetical protein